MKYQPIWEAIRDAYLQKTEHTMPYLQIVFPADTPQTLETIKQGIKDAKAVDSSFNGRLYQLAFRPLLPDQGFGFLVRVRQVILRHKLSEL